MNRLGIYDRSFPIELQISLRMMLEMRLILNAAKATKKGLSHGSFRISI